MAALILAMSCKENVPGTVAMVGLFLAWRGRRALGLSITALAVAWFLVAYKVVVPHFSPTGASFYSSALSIEPVPTNPNYPVLLTYIWRRAAYLVSTVGSVGGLCVLCPSVWALSLPEFAVTTLSSSAAFGIGAAHYHVLMAVGTVLGAAGGMVWLRNRWETRAGGTPAARRIAHRTVLAGVMLASLAFLRKDDTVLTQFRPGWFATRSPAQRDLARLLRQVPDEAPVITNDGGLASHLARRRLLIMYLTPGRVIPQVFDRFEKAEYIALSARPQYRDAAQQLARRHGLELAGHTPGYYLFRNPEYPLAPRESSFGKRTRVLQSRSRFDN